MSDPINGIGVRRWILNAIDFMGGKAGMSELCNWLSGADPMSVRKEVRRMVDEGTLVIDIDWKLKPSKGSRE